MNINPISTPQTTISKISTTQPLSNNVIFPEAISSKIHTIHLLANAVFRDIAPKSSFCKVIEAFDQPFSPETFKNCQRTYVEAFIEEFSNDEITLFLSRFFERFDPSHIFIDFSKLNNLEAQKFLWRGVIEHFSYDYLGFDLEIDGLVSMFERFSLKFDREHCVVKMTPVEYKAQIEAGFDQAVNIIPDFSADEIIQMKLMTIRYGALLITSLQQLSRSSDYELLIDDNFTIHDLLEEVIYMLLQVPYLPLMLDFESTNLDHLLDSYDHQSLKTSFVNALVEFALSSGEGDSYDAEVMTSVLKDCDFMDFEIKEIIHNIKSRKLKKM